MRLLGIDAGKEGALALLDTTDDSILLEDTRLDGNRELDGHWLFQLLLEWKPHRAIVEDCFRPKSLIQMVGEFLGVLKVLQVPATKVAVVKWKTRLLGENTSDKEKAIIKCSELHPSVPLVRPRCRTPNPDRAEAVLLAEYLRRTSRP